MHMSQADIGLIGLAVMGQNLALNIHDKGFTIAVFNRTTSKVDDFLAGPAKETGIIGTYSLEELFKNLKRPRRVLLMVKAGDPVDEFIEHCLPYMEPGDILIDGGNSLFTDTQRRCDTLEKKEMLFIGMGVSGGEEGARHGPSLMPGGHVKAWEHVKPIFQKICAKADSGEPCCEWVGSGGAGHYVKMVHNGIEYGDMQLICEAYHLLKAPLNTQAPDLHTIFKQWNQGELNSYLIEITADIFQYKEKDGSPLVDKILDVAGQKGTGKWTINNALDLGIPLTLIGEAVFARYLSALKQERVDASRSLTGPSVSYTGDKKAYIEQIRQGLYASKIISYTQGFMLMRQASNEYKWDLNYGNIAAIWRGGCIIRSRFLEDIRKAYHTNPQLASLLLDPFFKKEIDRMQTGWRKAASTAIEMGIPIPCMSTALTFYDGYRSAYLPVNLLQAQRDYFGAHTYERVDKPRGQYFHTNWTGRGGDVSSSSYNA
jgi:6-phosphogluconate dehydrogenase